MKERRKKQMVMQAHKYGGLRLQTINIILVVTAVLVSIILLVAVNNLLGTFRSLEEATDTYVTCQNDARDMMDASDYLTEQVRAFAATGEVTYLENYFEESEVVQRRDRALENMERNMPDSDALDYLEEALEQSIILMDREYYSMRLVVQARDYELSSFPQQVRDVKLSDRDRKLSPRDQMDRAKDMLYDNEYRSKKDKISKNVEDSLDQVLMTAETDHTKSAEAMETTVHTVSGFIAGMMLLFIAVVSMLIWLVIRPLEANIEHINNKAPLPMKGAYEMRYMASVFNRMYDDLNEQRDRLAYEAVHDHLTGLYNRAGFEECFQKVDRDSVALLLVDVDHFKDINDTYGHETGDMILQQVARQLRENFRQEDHICRIGGDEFAIILFFSDSSIKPVLKQKFEWINDGLMHPTGSLPPVSLSAGVAFGDRPDPSPNMYRDADEALYGVKRAGRGDIGFYGDEPKSLREGAAPEPSEPRE